MSDSFKITQSEIRAFNNIELSNAGQFSNNSFWYYTSADTAQKILSGKCFYASCLKRMNDLGEIKLHDGMKDHVHALCFVNSNSEKIPMWYLYGGITGSGVSLNITPGNMIKFIQSIKTVNPVNDDKKKLIIGKDIEMQYGWIYYRKPNQNKYSQVFYKNKWYTVDDTDGFENNNYFIKDYDWNYEKEFRLVFINKTGTPYEILKISFDDELLKKIKIKLAPEINSEIKDTLLRSDGVMKWAEANIQKSEIGIEMDLLGRNKESIINFIMSKTDKLSKEDFNSMFKS